MKSSDMIDRDQLLTRCLNDVEFTLQMLAVFCASAPKMARQLESAVSEGALADARRYAHTLKGSAANLAIEDLRRKAERLEMLADQSDLTALTSGVEELLRCVDESVQAANALSAKLERAQ
jgi:HPt (histidine-containing phosphotransfer) domain-containing protein